MRPALSLLLMIALALQGLLYFHIYFNMSISRSEKDVIGILIGITSNLQIIFRSMNILKKLILPISKHEYFFSFSVFYFINVLKFSL